MKYIATLEDMNEHTLYQVSDELYEKITEKIGNQRWTDFQKLYDDLVKNSDDKELNELWDQLRSSPVIDCEFIQIY
jgi:uncharacterized protein YeaO (DUF488 family)